jgi:chromosome transmission fidelity protein 4
MVRCTAPVRDVAYSASDKWVAVASEDMELRLVDGKSFDTHLLREHDGGVRSVCFDPKVSHRGQRVKEAVPRLTLKAL